MICTKCNKDLDESNFHSRGEGKKHKQCKYCKRKAIKRHYENNKAVYIDKAKKSNQKIKKQIIDLTNNLKSVPCADCKKEFPPYCMDFDHVDPSNKLYNVSELRNHTSIKKVLAEVEKCEVVCAICHRIRTYNRRNKKCLQQ